MLRAIFAHLLQSKFPQRVLTTLAFGTFIYLGVSGISDAIQLLINPAFSASMLDMSASSVRVRAAVLFSLNTGIIVGGSATILGIWQSTRLVYGWAVIALMYVGLGGYQIIDGLFERGRLAFTLTGLAYLALAAVAYHFGRRAIHVATSGR
ncbi:MAG: hypothetical protein RMN25_07600 [Anaerolineae bacterium]|nr:hypothetical protein [Thermoflexales bacterium]MDW8407635.1 hypothetical protein [Anaerolineae bacterium]